MARWLRSAIKAVQRALEGAPGATLAVILLCLPIVMGGVAGCASGAFTPERSLSRHADRLAPHVEIILPETATGAVPAALLFSGCGGVRQVQSDYAQAAADAGYAAMIVDSHALRGIGRTAARLQVCTALRLWGQARAADVFAAIELARRDPRLDAERLYLVGWSHGGWTLLDALSFAADGETPPGLSALPAEPLAGVAEALAIYPYCGVLSRAEDAGLAGSAPVFALLAEDDLVVSPQRCADVLEDAQSNGAAVDWMVKPGVTHAFDAPDQAPDPRMEYDPQAASEARALFVERMEERAGAP